MAEKTGIARIPPPTSPRRKPLRITFVTRTSFSAPGPHGLISQGGAGASLPPDDREQSEARRGPSLRLAALTEGPASGGLHASFARRSLADIEAHARWRRIAVAGGRPAPANTAASRCRARLRADNGRPCRSVRAALLAKRPSARTGGSRVRLSCRRIERSAAEDALRQRGPRVRSSLHRMGDSGE